jgi:hypothetical protein
MARTVDNLLADVRAIIHSRRSPHEAAQAQANGAILIEHPR